MVAHSRPGPNPPCIRRGLPCSLHPSTKLSKSTSAEWSHKRHPLARHRRQGFRRFSHPPIKGLRLRSCVSCSAPFEQTNGNQRYCGQTCRERSRWDRADRVPCSVCSGPTGYKLGTISSATHNRCRTESAREGHGTDRAYRLGCRCSHCKAACAARQRAYLAKRNEIRHTYPPCVVDGCDRDARARGMCQKHYRISMKAEGKWRPSPSDHWTNPSKRARAAERKAILRGASPHDSERFTISDLMHIYGSDCSICGEPIPASLAWPHPLSASIDHVTPLSKGGKHRIDNAKPAHLACNMRKGAGTEVQPCQAPSIATASNSSKTAHA